MIHHPASDLLELEKAMDGQDFRGVRGLREEASLLLSRLEKGREFSERRAAETGQRDPMKFITGRSAYDSAIMATRGMIARMDALLSEMEGEIDEMERDEAAHRANGHAALACAGSAT